MAVNFRIVELTQGKQAIVDVEDYPLVSKYKWHLSGAGYAVRTVNRKNKVYMHREINNTPADKFTDHINGNRLDNRRSNLRTCYRSGNAMNIGKPKGKSGFIGVYSTGKRWRARVKIGGTMKHLGSFTTPELASKARNKYVNQYIKAGI
jgi:hypothetical protein